MYYVYNIYKIVIKVLGNKIITKEFIKQIIDERVKNLHPNTEEQIIELVLNSKLDGIIKIRNFIRKELDLPKFGSNTTIYWVKRGWSMVDANEKKG